MYHIDNNNAQKTIKNEQAFQKPCSQWEDIDFNTEHKTQNKNK